MNREDEVETVIFEALRYNAIEAQLVQGLEVFTERFREFHQEIVIPFANHLQHKVD